MLVLTRRINESIFIDGDKIKITFLGKPSPCQMRVGIEAPPEVEINREELYYRKKQSLREKINE